MIMQSKEKPGPWEVKKKCCGKNMRVHRTYGILGYWIKCRECGKHWEISESTMVRMKNE